jgi:hypothetical protein
MLGFGLISGRPRIVNFPRVLHHCPRCIALNNSCGFQDHILCVPHTPAHSISQCQTTPRARSMMTKTHALRFFSASSGSHICSPVSQVISSSKLIEPSSSWSSMVSMTICTSASVHILCGIRCVSPHSGLPHTLLPGNTPVRPMSRNAKKDAISLLSIVPL